MEVPSAEARSLEEYLHEVAPDVENPRWYRGVGDSSRPLLPRLYRHPTITDTKTLIESEYDLLIKFQQRGILFDPRERRDDWDYLFLMQHVGVPTRLLDWTESPLMALHFAVEAANRRESDAAVWIVDPVAWNRSALSHTNFARGILATGDIRDEEFVALYAPGRQQDQMNKAPVAVSGLYSNPRIVAQRGAFMIFGIDATDMPASDTANKSESLRRVIVPADAVGPVRGALRASGVTDSVVFPDLDGLARELRIEYGFE